MTLMSTHLEVEKEQGSLDSSVAEFLLDAVSRKMKASVNGRGREKEQENSATQTLIRICV
jgi:hypothetical protein